jgi:hypothetical protein
MVTQGISLRVIYDAALQQATNLVREKHLLLRRVPVFAFFFMADSVSSRADQRWTLYQITRKK